MTYKNVKINEKEIGYFVGAIIIIPALLDLQKNCSLHIKSHTAYEYNKLMRIHEHEIDWHRKSFLLQDRLQNHTIQACTTLIRLMKALTLGIAA